MSNKAGAEIFVGILLERIESAGRVTVARFMEWALYDPLYGYYTRGPNIGPRGDFTTSPEASPAFGRLLARHIADIDALLEHPSSFDLIECGPGTGALADNLLDELSASNPDLYRRLRYRLVEISPALRQSQRDRLEQKHAARLSWAESMDELPKGLEGAVIGNEFIDAFPVHVVACKGGKLQEQYIAVGASELTYVLGPPSDGELEHFIARHSIHLNDGEITEINLGARRWFGEAARVLARGVVTLIDYGDTQPARYSEARREGTLLGYYGGAVTHNILEHPGSQDLTALVDFTALQDEATEAGFETLGLLRQAALLVGLGLGTTVGMVDGGGDELVGALHYRRGLQSLISMEGLGKFHVLVLGKGLGPDDAGGYLSGLKYAGLL